MARAGGSVSGPGGLVLSTSTVRLSTPTLLLRPGRSNAFTVMLWGPSGNASVSSTNDTLPDTCTGCQSTVAMGVRPSSTKRST